MNQQKYHTKYNSMIFFKIMILKKGTYYLTNNI